MENNQKPLQTARLSIRRVAAGDWPNIRAIWEDFSRSPYARYDRPFETNPDTVRARIARWASFAESDEHMFFAICLHDTVIGYVAFNAREKGYEIGYNFHSNYHRQGYAKESISALLHHLGEHGVTVVTAGTAISNIPSVALLCSLGFVQTGTEDVSFYRDADGRDIVFEGGIFEMRLNRPQLTSAQALWDAYRTQNPSAPEELDAWAFGDDPDTLADLVLRGIKTATCSLRCLYDIEDEPLPEADTYSVVLNSRDEAVCVIRTTRVYVTPFSEITPEHAYREGEGDRSYAYWRDVHEAFFAGELRNAGIDRPFDESMEAVCEEFEVVFTPQDIPKA